MLDGWIKVAAGTPTIKVADCAHNALALHELMREADKREAKLLVTPELSVTGYTAADLFLHPTLRRAAMEALAFLVKNSEGSELVSVVGLPLEVEGRLYNCAAVIQNGVLLGVVPKRNLPNYGAFYETRYFVPGDAEVRTVNLLGRETPFGGNLLFECNVAPDFRFAIEIGEDLWAPDPPGVRHALAGATVIAAPSASAELAGKAEYRRMLVKSQSARLTSGYVYADAGRGESTTDLVFSGHNLICENGSLLVESKLYEEGLVFSDVDVGYLAAERVRVNSFACCRATHTRIGFSVKSVQTKLDRLIDPAPFVSDDPDALARRCEEILDIQAEGVMQRMRHIHAKCAVMAISGGLDSTLALIVTARAFERMVLPKKGLLAVTMPGFGTTGRTYKNALALIRELGATMMEIDIRPSVTRHFEDIGHDPSVLDATYENAQARERTQILMDLANQRGGLAVGTGDLSEMALGWTTYNGDHMSMYGVNASIPKTLVRHLVRHAALQTGNENLRRVLLDILDTPVSPELLPPTNGEISQMTEDSVGPYALHDFFLYHFIRRMSTPGKILRLARIAFEGEYDPSEIEKWLEVFILRFFSQQFKRSCMPDGPKVGSVSLSPRGDFRMPSDASNAAWLVK